MLSRHRWNEGNTRRRTGRVVGVVLLAAGLEVRAQPVPLFSKGPYLQAPGVHTMTVMWESLTNHPGTVHFGLDGRLDQSVGPVPSRTMEGVSTVRLTNAAPGGRAKVTSISRTNRFYIYEAVLENLAPAALYTYSVELSGVRSLPKRFKTLGGNAEKIRFIAYGDTRSRPEVHAAVARQFPRYNPEFILHTGDLVAKGKDYGLWSREFFGPLAGVIDEIPVLPALGNHEDDGANYLAYFHLPGRERWYSFEAGPVHVLGLDYHYPRGDGEQFRFAREDLLTCDAPWKVVIVHYPMFTLGGHLTAWGHDAYLPLFHEARVDLVLAGHSHLYERFRPIVPQATARAWAITHITTGGGGANLARSWDHPALETRAAANHFVVFEATADALTGVAVLPSGRSLDRFELRKSMGQPLPGYSARAYPEELLQTTLALASPLTGQLTGIPGVADAAPVTFTLQPLRSSAGPAELEITLAPESAATYRLEDAPLRVSTPTPGGLDHVVWARVWATGRNRVVAGDNNELSPALIFRAQVRIAEGETLAYGHRSRLSETTAEAARQHSP